MKLLGFLTAKLPARSGKCANFAERNFSYHSDLTVPKFRDCEVLPIQL